MKNIAKRLLSFTLCLIMLFSFFACEITTDTESVEIPHANAKPLEKPEEKPEEKPKPSTSLIDDSMFIKAEGELLKTAAGDTVYLRGVNVSSFVTENWMLKIVKETVAEDGTTSRTYDRLITETWLKRFGLEKTKALWEEYRRNYFSDTDFQLLKDMGVNCIRLPITYMTVDLESVYDYNLAAYDYDFSAVDAFIEKAASYGIYTILDLHGAYGSQNGADHSGEFKDPKDIDFYYNEEMMQLTVDLWRAMAEHYKGNPAIAAYDILNEPAEHKVGGGTMTTTTRHWKFMDRLYDAIREVDKDHVVIVPPPTLCSAGSLRISYAAIAGFPL